MKLIIVFLLSGSSKQNKKSSSSLLFLSRCFILKNLNFISFIYRCKKKKHYLFFANKALGSRGLIQLLEKRTFISSIFVVVIVFYSFTYFAMSFKNANRKFNLNLFYFLASLAKQQT